MSRSPIVGITGGIGSGKSVICRILSLRGYCVYDCDSKARQLMHTPEIASALKTIVGEDVFDLKGNLDRRNLASKIFSDSRLLESVNTLVHEAVRNNIAVCASLDNRVPLFVESAILSTSGIAHMADIIWVIDSPLQTRIKRVKQRNPELTLEEIQRRIDVQKRESVHPDDKPVRIIDNSGAKPLLPQLDKLLKEIEHYY